MKQLKRAVQKDTTTATLLMVVLAGINSILISTFFSLYFTGEFLDTINYPVFIVALIIFCVGFYDFYQTSKE